MVKEVRLSQEGSEGGNVQQLHSGNPLPLLLLMQSGNA